MERFTAFDLDPFKNTFLQKIRVRYQINLKDYDKFKKTYCKAVTLQ